MRNLYQRVRRSIRPTQRVLATLAAVVVAPVIPSAFDPVLVSTVHRVHLRLLPHRRRQVATKMAEQFPERDLTVAATDYWRQRVETRWGQARAIGPRGWHPAIEVVGAERVATALQQGAGVVLWRVSSHSAIPLDRVLADRGHPAVHLSRSGHLLIQRGRLFTRYVAPSAGRLLARGETRELRARVVITADSVVGGVRRLMDALGENSVVTIVGDLAAGRRTHAVSVNSDVMTFATGGADLSSRSGAALIPVTTTRLGSMRYQVEFHEPLSAPSGAPRPEAVPGLIEDFAAVVARFTANDPSQWPKWRDTLS